MASTLHSPRYNHHYTTAYSDTGPNTNTANLR